MPNNPDLKKCPNCGGEAKAQGHIPDPLRNSSRVFYYMECQDLVCGIIGPRSNSPETSAESWNEFAGIAERAAEEQMEADCKALCLWCRDPELMPAVNNAPKGESWWSHDKDGMFYMSCDGHEIREAFRAANESEEVEGE